MQGYYKDPETMKPLSMVIYTQDIREIDADAPENY